MEKRLEELYREAKRFDEGGLYQSEEYQRIAIRQVKLYKEMRVLFGGLFAKLMEEYFALQGDELEMECRHFFEQGYIMGRRADSSGQGEENRV